ncbi:MAG: hypothetical protein IJ677_02510, partial [Alphaproteobacteria bacterium]|nr:hypothetical protein [Alphaproteobacteria bacterium]
NKHITRSEMITDFIKYVFFTLLLNPMILVGIAIGVYIMRHYNYSNIHYIINNKALIFTILSSSFLYATLFTHVYHINSTRINWTATLGKIFLHIFTIFISATCTCCVIYTLSHVTYGKIDAYLRNKRPITTVDQNTD